jgi:hypothetical protein
MVEKGMTSRRQMRANRENAARSTGPNTPEGRAISSANAVRHGILSNRFIADHENHDVFAGLLRDLITEFEPETALESLLVERLAILFWRERRLATAEAEQANLHYADGAVPFGSGPQNVPISNQFLIGRYQGLLGRQIKDTLKDLRDEREKRFRHIQLPIVDELSGEDEF